MPITNLDDLGLTASGMLREAMLHERTKRWPKVVQSYRRLLRMLDKNNLPQDFDPPPWMPKLYFELYFHLGLALQQIEEHTKAVVQYTKSIESISTQKSGCTGNCGNTSCLMTPVYARRAFANAQSGDLNKALKDAEKAVVLDNKNPDVYCIRALVRSTRGEQNEAFKDSELALKYNPNHPCALLLHGTLTIPKRSNLSESNSDIPEWARPPETIHPDHIKACHINPDCHNYLSVRTFKHPDILTFFDRFFYSLGVPHTLSTVVLKAEGNNHHRCAHQHKANMTNSVSNFTSGENDSFVSPMKFLRPSRDTSARPFKCGTTRHVREQSTPSESTVVRRRKEYGEAIRQKVQRPKTADEYIAWLEQEYRKKAQLHERRAMSASIARQQSDRILKAQVEANRPASANVLLPDTSAYLKRPQSSSSQLRYGKAKLRVPETKIFLLDPKSNEPQKNIHLQIFTPINVKEAPRMYYRPWSGDKLPVAEKKKFTPAPVFKC